MFSRIGGAIGHINIHLPADLQNAFTGDRLDSLGTFITKTVLKGTRTPVHDLECFIEGCPNAVYTVQTMVAMYCDEKGTPLHFAMGAVCCEPHARTEKLKVAMYAAHEERIARTTTGRITNIESTCLGCGGDVGSDGYFLVPKKRYVCAKCKDTLKRCDECASMCPNPKVCSRCKEARYCNKACQQKAWKMHRQVCARISKEKENK